MTSITADGPPLAFAHEALSSILAQHGRARMAAWARAADEIDEAQSKPRAQGR